MTRLLTEVRNNSRRFSYLPIGPIGAKIKLKDYTWATAVEQVAKKGFLFSFIVDNHRDADVLRGMVKSIYREGPRPDVIVSPFQDTVYDVRKNVSVQVFTKGGSKKTTTFVK